MLYVISIILMVAMIMGGILLAASPDFLRVVNRDFVRKTNQNAMLHGLQWADLALRVRNMDPDTNNEQVLDVGWVERKGAVTVENITCNILTFDASGDRIRVDINHSTQ